MLTGTVCWISMERFDSDCRFESMTEEVRKKEIFYPSSAELAANGLFLLGKQCAELDVNSMKPLDNLCHPISVIKEAEDLAAEAFGAAHAFLMVGGTTSAVQTMVLTASKKGEKIILPRNVH